MKPIQYEVRNTSGDWSPYFGDVITEPQRFGKFDTDDCWDMSPCKGTIEIQCNYLISIGAFTVAAMTFFQTNGFLDANGSMKISERYPEILSKNKDNGGTAQQAMQLFQEYGCIPWSMLNYTDAQASQWTTKAQFNADYFNLNAVTPAMLSLGRQFLKYVNIAYQRIGTLGTTPAVEILQAAIKQAPLQYDVFISTNTMSWNEVNVPAPTIPLIYNTNATSHEITGTSINPDGSKVIVDNYAPFVKTLAPNYPLEAVLQGIVTAIPDNPSPIPQNSTINAFWQAVIGWWNGIFYPNENVGNVVSFNRGNSY